MLSMFMKGYHELFCVCADECSSSFHTFIYFHPMQYILMRDIIWPFWIWWLLLVSLDDEMCIGCMLQNLSRCSSPSRYLCWLYRDYEVFKHHADLMHSFSDNVEHIWTCAFFRAIPIMQMTAEMDNLGTVSFTVIQWIFTSKIQSF